MKKLLFSFLSLTAVCSAVMAQSFRSVSVWRNGEATDYSLVTMDSIEFNQADSTMVIYTGFANKEAIAGIDSDR